VSLSLLVNSSQVYARAAGNPVYVHLPIISYQGSCSTATQCHLVGLLVGAVFCKLACFWNYWL